MDKENGTMSAQAEERVPAEEVSTDLEEHPVQAPGKLVPWLITIAILSIVALVASVWIVSRRAEGDTPSAEHSEPKPGGHSGDEKGEEVRLDAESIRAAGIETEAVTQRPAIAKLYVTGSIELNPEKTEMASPLVNGRVLKVFSSVGDHVEKGQILATISSPQLAQMHGKMHEAQTQYELALRNAERVQKAENRVNVLEAKARLDEAQATLDRTKRLIELGAGAGKDLIAAETAFRTAKATYEFQTNISLNKEIQEARAAVETARVDLHHIQDEMRALGVPVDSHAQDDHSKDTSLVLVRSPLSGMITERRVNAGAGINANDPAFVISDLGTVYVIANVPQANVSFLTLGSMAEVRTASVGTTNGRISFIDPRIDEETRTARVRVEVANPDRKLRAGMFTEVGFYSGPSSEGGQELVVRTEAIQRSGGKTYVFVPRENEPGAFEVREIEAGGDVEGYTRVISGLELGEQVVTKGSFVLKTQLEKESLGDEH